MRPGHRFRKKAIDKKPAPKKAIVDKAKPVKSRKRKPKRQDSE